MKSFREWLRESELNESISQIDLKKYFKNPGYTQDKFRKEIDKELSKIFKDYYASEEDIKKSIKSDIFLVTAHQLKNNKSVVENRVYMCNTSPIGIANFKGDVILTEFVTGKKIKFELGGGINDRLELLNKRMAVSSYYEVLSHQRLPDKISNIFIGNVMIEGVNGKVGKIEKSHDSISCSAYELEDAEYNTHLTRKINDTIKSSIEDVKYK